MTSPVSKREGCISLPSTECARPLLQRLLRISETDCVVVLIAKCHVSAKKLWAVKAYWHKSKGAELYIYKFCQCNARIGETSLDDKQPQKVLKVSCVLFFYEALLILRTKTSHFMSKHKHTSRKHEGKELTFLVVRDRSKFTQYCPVPSSNREPFTSLSKFSWFSGLLKSSHGGDGTDQHWPFLPISSNLLWPVTD